MGVGIHRSKIALYIYDKTFEDNDEDKIVDTDFIERNMGFYEILDEWKNLIKNIDYPYYVNRLENDHIRNFSIITVTFVNTSEAFTRLRFDEATIKHNDDDVVARYNMSTFGAHRNHVMLKKGDTGKVGLLIGNDLLDQLRGTKLTIASYLDNNFRECFWDEQSYHISDVCEETVTFMPIDVSKNIFKKVK